MSEGPKGLGAGTELVVSGAQLVTRAFLSLWTGETVDLEVSKNIHSQRELMQCSSKNQVDLDQIPTLPLTS